MCTISALSAVPCASNAPGTKQTAYIVPASEITVMPPYVGTTDEGDYVVASTAFDFTGAGTGKGYFRSFPVLIDRNSYSIEAQGGIGSKSWKETFNFVILGVNEEQLEFATRLLNIPCVFLIEDRNGKVHVIGRKDDPAYVESATGSTGASPTDERMIDVTVSASTARPMIYTGAIDTTPNT